MVLPETVNAYEVGFKGNLFDRKLTIAVAAFLADDKTLQVQANRSDPSTNTFNFVTTNAGKSQTKGVEIEAILRPNEHFSLNASASYIHARFDADGIACPLQNQAAAATVAYNAAAPVNTGFKATGATGAIAGAAQNIRDGILRSPDHGLSFAIFAKNLTDQRYYTTMGANSLLTTQAVTPTNRTAFLPKGAFRYFGASVGYKF